MAKKWEWTPEEDARLLDIVSQESRALNAFRRFSKESGRTVGAVCFRYYHNHYQAGEKPTQVVKTTIVTQVSNDTPYDQIVNGLARMQKEIDRLQARIRELEEIEADHQNRPQIMGCARKADFVDAEPAPTKVRTDRNGNLERMD